MACIMGSGSKGISPTSSSNISSNSRQLRWLAARQVRFTRASSSVADVTKNLSLSSSTLPFRTSPWLMLPPKDLMFNRFYTLEEKIVIPINKHMTTRTTTTSDHEMMDDEPLCIGSSHGWLVYINRSDNGGALFLYNPISHRIIKLPSIETLPVEDEPDDLEPYKLIEKLILSSSPNEEEDEEHNRCIALCIYGSGRNLGFCKPRHDTAWIPLDEDFDCYKQIVYSSKDKLFYCFSDVYDRLDCWDLGDPLSPKRKFVVDLVKEEEQKQDQQEQELESVTSVYTYLIADPWSSSSDDDSLFIIERFVAWGIREDGSPVDFTPPDDSYPYKTLFFKVYKLDFSNGLMKYMKHSLNDRVLFVGMNQSFSLPACDFPHLSPNSIYFTDDRTHRIWDATWDSDEYTAPHGGHDMGIFNYQDKRFESCYYPCDVKSIKRIMPPPIWFTPNPRNPLPRVGNYAFLFHDDGCL